MKLSRLLAITALAALSIAGCKEPIEDFGPAKLEVNSTSLELNFDSSEGLQTVEIVATREWNAVVSEDAKAWLSVEPVSGSASNTAQKVGIGVLANSDYDRTGKVTFNLVSGGLTLKDVTLTVTQKGAKGSNTHAGTKEDPYNASEALAMITAGTFTDIEVYVKGKISEISSTDPPGNGHGNATYWISDDGTATDHFEIFRGYGLGGEMINTSDYIKVGDEVVVCGVLSLYNTTPEMAQGSWIYSLNGTVKEKETPDSGTPKGSGTLEDPYNPAGAAAAAAKLTWSSNDNYQTTDNVYVKGKISRIAANGTYTEGGTYGNASFYIVDSEDGTGEFYMFRILYLGNKKFVSGQTDIKVGDEVVVYGKLMNYRGNTPETEAGSAYLYSLNGDTGSDTPDNPGTPKGSGTLDDPYNPAGAAAVAAKLTWTSNDNYETTDPVYVKGKISKIADKGTYTESGEFGNATFYVVDAEDGTGEFYMFRILYLGNQKYVEGQTDIKVGDEVIVYGKLMNYKGNTPETVSNEAYLYSLNGETSGGDTPDPGTPKGSGTLDDPYNPAGAAAAVENLTWTSNDDYESTDPVYVKGRISKIANKGTYTESGEYGNATFYIVDAEDGTGEFYIFHTLYLGNQKYVEGQTDIKVGDEVIVYGKLMNYKGNTPETVSGESYLYSLNGKTDPEDYFTVSPLELNVSAAATSATFNISSNVDWTIDSDNQVFLPDIFSGNGNATITLDFPANDSDAARSANITVSTSAEVATKSYTVVITQAAPGSGSGATVVFDLTAQGYENAQEVSSLTIDGVTLAFNKGTNSNTPKFYTTGNAVRVYGGGFLTLSSADNTITKVEFTFGSGDGNYALSNELSADSGSLSGNTWTGGASSVKFNIGGTSGHRRFAKLVVTLGDGGSQGGGEEGGEGGSQGGGEGNAPIAVSVADFLSAGESSDQPYQLTGVVGPHNGSINNTYGNFDLTDDSGTVYVYGLTATNLGYGASNDKSFSSLGIAEGDNITIEGFRGSYTNPAGVKTDEVLYAYLIKKNDSGQGGDIVSSFGVDKTEIAAAASGTSASFNVTGNVAWTATCDNDAFTLDKTSGTGAAEVKVTFEANADTENAKVANITVSTDADVETKSYTVVLTQAAAEAPAAGTTVITFEQEEVKSTDMTGTKEGVTWINSSDYGTTVPTELRVYKGQQLTISSSTTKIEKVVFTCTANGANRYGPGNLVPDTGSYTYEEDGATGTWTGSAYTIYFTSNDNQTRIVKIEVTLGSDASGSGGSDSGASGSKYPLIDTDIRSLLLAYRSPYQTYRVSGFIGDDLDATKGVFTLSDDTGSIKVDGVTAGRRLYGDLNDKSFSNLGLGVGDQITLIGYRDGYKEENYLSYAYFVDGKSSTLSVDPSSISVDAAATSTTFTVSGNVAWTATSDNSDFSLGPASGSSGSTVVTVVFDPNTDTQNARTCNITVTDATGAYTATVVITQDKYEAPCASVAEISAKITSTDRNNPSSYEASLQTPAVVSYVNGSNVFMQDATGGILLYKSNTGLVPGNTVGGSFSGTGYKYNALPEITGIDGATIGQGTAPDPEVVTIATLLSDFNSYLSKLVKIEGVTIVGSTDGSKKASVTITQGNDQMILYTQVSSIKLQDGAKGDVIVIPTIFNTTKEAGLWEQDNFIADPNAKTFSVSTDKINVSSSAGTATFNIEGNVSWTVESSDQSFEVSPSSGSGAGTVTVTYPANNDTSAIAARIIVSTTDDVPTKSYTVVITQASALAAGSRVATIDFSTLGYENGVQYKTTTFEDLTVTMGDGGNDGKYYDVGTGMRIYGNGYVKIEAGGATITNIVYTWSGTSNCPVSNSANANYYTVDTGTYSGAGTTTGTWNGSASSVKLTRNTGSGHWRLQKVEVTYSK